jgi:hypothetical protein
LDEITRLEALEPEHPVFGCLRVAAKGNATYEVEIDLVEHANSCGCTDHRVSLSTCKHIEGMPPSIGGGMPMPARLARERGP